MLDKEAGLLLDWKGSSLSVFLSVCLQGLCPQDVLKAVVVTDTDQSALKTAIQNSHPAVAYKNPQDVLKGEGHCEVHHMGAKVSAKNEEHVFVCFLSILHGRQRSVRQADVRFSFSLSSGEKRDCKMHLSISFLFPSLLS